MSAVQHEVVDLDHVAGAAGRRLDLVLVEDDVLARGDLVALHDLLVGDLLVLLRAEAPVLDARPVLEVDLVEVNGLGLGRRVQLHGDVHDPDGDRPVPDRPRHRCGSYPQPAGWNVCGGSEPPPASSIPERQIAWTCRSQGSLARRVSCAAAHQPWSPWSS